MGLRLFRRHRTPKATIQDPPRHIRLQMVGGQEAEIVAPWFAFRAALANGHVLTVLGHNDDQLVVVTRNVAFARPLPESG